MNLRHRMPARTGANIQRITDRIDTLRPADRTEARCFQLATTPQGLFEILHSMRRWYSGQTMARKLLSYRDHLRRVMDLDPSDVAGVYRGFHVPRDSPIGKRSIGDEISLPVTRNHGFSSWSTTEAPTHRFSGANREHLGVIVRLVGGRSVVPVLAPPDRTVPWFNRMYERCIGTAFRPTEGEYLISGSRVNVRIVRIKR